MDVCLYVNCDQINANELYDRDHEHLSWIYLLESLEYHVEYS